MSKTTFSQHQIAPDGRAMLSCSCLRPDGWMSVPVPEEEYDFENPSTFIPLLVCMAPYGAVVFSIAARPSFDDGSVQDWAEYLVTQQNLQLEQVREARIDRMPCILVESTMASDAGEMRSRSVFLEDGRRLFTIQALAPDAIWESVRADFDVLLGSFRLAEQHGITAAPMRLMTSDPVLDLSALGTAPSRAPDLRDVQEVATLSVSAPTGDTTDDSAHDEGGQPDDTPARARDLALAEDAATLDPDHVINARLRDAGAGLVPRVLRIDAEEQYAVVGAGAIEAMFHVPFGWHVIDDGRRTLVFDPAGGVQINLNLRPTPADEIISLLQGIGDELARENPQALFMKLELMGMPCLAVRDLLIDGETLDQAYLARPSHREDLALVCRVTSDRANMTRAVDTAEVILRSLEHAPMVDPEFAGQPDWWREAVLLERRDRVDEAEQVIQRALDHIGVYSTLARLHEQRMARLSAEGRDDEARIAKARAIQWLNTYAASATSGGEGAALSLERDDRIASLGGEG